MILTGKVADVDPKMGKDRSGNPSNTPWLVKFKFITDSQSLWLGAYTQKPNAPKAFASKVMEERDLADGQKTLWELEYEEVTEGEYTNYYVTSARSLAPDTPTATVTTSEVTAPVWKQVLQGSWASKLDTTGRSIIRQVAFKEIENKDGKEASALMALTDLYEEIILGSWEPLPDGDDEEDEDLFGDSA